jgi:hypothetical protein
MAIDLDVGTIPFLQFAAIKRAISVGERLQRDMPEIVTAYREGSTYKEIAEIYDVACSYQITSDISANAVRYAMRGSREGNYPGLIRDKSELERLALEHQHTPEITEVRRQWGYELQETRRGIFDQSKMLEMDQKKRLKLLKKGHLVADSAEDKYIDANIGDVDLRYRKDFDYEALQRDINERFHQGKEVRKVDHLQYVVRIKCLNKFGRVMREHSEALKVFIYNASRLPEYQNGNNVSLKNILEEGNRLFYDGEEILTPRMVSSIIEKQKSKRGVETKKYRPWTDEELELVESCVVSEEYQISRGLNRKRIYQELNLLCEDENPHSRRSLDALICKLNKSK